VYVDSNTSIPTRGTNISLPLDGTSILIDGITYVFAVGTTLPTGFEWTGSAIQVVSGTDAGNIISDIISTIPTIPTTFPW
jgi:hypothetical protein